MKFGVPRPARDLSELRSLEFANRRKPPKGGASEPRASYLPLAGEWRLGNPGETGLAGEQAAGQRLLRQLRLRQRLSRGGDIEGAIAGTPKDAVRAARHRQRDDPLHLAGRIVADDAAVDRLRAPHESLRVHCQSVGKTVGARVEPNERAPVRDFPSRRIEVIGEDAVAEALGVIHGAAVGAPTGAVRAFHVVLHQPDALLGIEAIERAGWREPIFGAHGASPQSSLAIAFSVVEPVVRPVRLGIGKNLQMRGVWVKEGEGLAHGEHQAAFGAR